MAEKEKAAAEEEEEDLSDVDDTPLLALRRRAAASDDDEEGGGGGRGSPPPSTVAGSDSDPDEQGAAEVYDEDEGSEKCEGVQEDFDAGRGGGEAKGVADEGKYEEEEEEEEEEAHAKGGAAVEGEDNEKNGVKPYAVPRIGPFFQHDDRFQDKENGSRGRQREFFGGQKLWNHKDDSVWLHDRFDEVNIHDVQHDNTRRPTIPFRAWGGGRTHGVNHGYLEGTNSPSYYHGNRSDYNYIPKKSLARYESSNNYNRFPKEAHTSYDDNAKNYRNVPIMNIHDVQHDNARWPTIPFRAWGGGRTHGVNHGYLEGTKSPSYYHGNRADYNYIPKKSLARYESSNNYNRFPKEAHTSYDDNAKNYRSVPRKFHSYYYDKNFDNDRREPCIYYVNAKGYSDAPNVYRGKPSRPYQPHWKNTFGISSVQSNRTYFRSQNEETCSDAGEGQHSYRTLNLQNEHDFPVKQELPFIQTRRSRPAVFSKLFSTSVRMAHSSLRTQSRPVFGVKALVPSGGNGNSVDSHSSVSTSNNYSQYSKSRDKGSGLNITEPSKNKFSSTSQATRSYSEFSNAVYQQRSVHQLQPRQRASTQIFHQNIASTENIQSHPQAMPTSSTEDAETSPPPGSKNSEAPSLVIGKNDEEPVSAYFPHDGGHALDVTGGRGLTLGDQGFAGTLAVLPVMQFSGQHPSGPNIPSIGMVLPGLLTHQPCGNSEINQITWLPTLSGATGSFGTTYHPSYLGSYYPQPSELPSSVSPRNHSVTGVPVSLNSHEMPEVVGHELNQRKNKPRRYSEMSFASLT